VVVDPDRAAGQTSGTPAPTEEEHG
jgi:hypothetical protein